MRWFHAFLSEVTNERAYKRTFDHSLTALFGGFPGDLIPSLKRDVDLDDLMRSLRADGNTARESAVYAATALISALIAPLSDTERQAAIEALERHDDQNSVYRGFHYMLHVVEQLGVKPALLSRISYEMVGLLHGVSREAIQAWWTEAEVPRLIDGDGVGAGDCRALCSEEARWLEQEAIMRAQPSDTEEGNWRAEFEKLGRETVRVANLSPPRLLS
jgi:hypothetical protein